MLEVKSPWNLEIIKKIECHNQNEIEKRITNFATRGITKRPGQSFSSLFKERQKLYMKYFDYKVDTTHLTIDATLKLVEKIAQS